MAKESGNDVTRNNLARREMIRQNRKPKFPEEEKKKLSRAK